jgi:hypothetical protein
MNMSFTEQLGWFSYMHTWLLIDNHSVTFATFEVGAVVLWVLSSLQRNIVSDIPGRALRTHPERRKAHAMHQ